MSNKDVVIIGAGAAGLMCAYQAALLGHKVTVVEHNRIPGRKILISGGGRCNFTNTYSTFENFRSNNKHFLKSALKRYTPHDFISLVEESSIEYVEKKDGQQFCKTSAHEIVNLFINRCNKLNVNFQYLTKVMDIDKIDNKFVITTSKDSFTADKLVIATGGLSISQIGASDFGHKIARKFGHKVLELNPALVPFTLERPFVNLAGVAIDCLVSSKIKSFRENILFTHKGLSGPAILQVSSYWYPKENIEINFLPENDLVEDVKNLKKVKGSSGIKKYLSSILPNKFVDKWCDIDKNIADLSKEDIEVLINKFQRWTIVPSGTEGYRKAEVTRGGICTDSISSKTMESKTTEGLYFIGEVLDVTGELGGHNFQWAWASGYACANSV